MSVYGGSRRDHNVIKTIKMNGRLKSKQLIINFMLICSIHATILVK